MLILDSVTPLERIKLSAELAANTSAAAAAKGMEKVRVAKAIADLIQRLGGNVSAPATPEVAYSLNDPESSEKSLSAYLDSGMAGLPDVFKVFERDTVSVLAKEVGSLGLGRRVDELSSASHPNLAAMQEAKIAAYEELMSRGISVAIDREKVAASYDEIAGAAKKNIREFPEYKVAYDAVQSYVSEAQERSRVLFRTANDRSLSEAETEAAIKALELFRNVEYPARISELKAEADQIAKDWNDRQTMEREERLSAPGKLVINALLDASPVTEADAKAWAAQQVIDDNAKAKLKRLGYKPDQVVADMAEFYRITGGKASAICLAINGSRRANAVGVNARLGEKVINIGAHFDKTTLFHEMGHFLENDPIAQGASGGFLLKRRESDKVFSLRSLTGNSGYSPNEGAYKDSWLNAYIGKVYRTGVTEVFSMGVQYLANPADAAMLAAKDPEMFALISGYLSSPLTPAMKAKLNMHGAAIGSLQAKRKTKDELYNDSIAALAAKVTLTKDDWWLENRNDHHFNWVVTGSTADRKEPEYIGSYGDYKVFFGSYRNKKTKRASKGHFVFRVLGERQPRSDEAPIHGGIEYAKALIAVAQINGKTLSPTFYDYFYAGRVFGDSKQRIIELAGLPEKGVAE